MESPRREGLPGQGTGWVDAPLGAQLGLPALSFGDEDLDLADLVLCGWLTGAWPRLLAEMATGHARAGDAGAGPLPDELKKAATAWRYAHRLISAADFVAWLEQRALTPSDLAGTLGRRIRAVAAEGSPPPAPDAGALGGALRADALCLDVLAACANAAIVRMAAARGLDDEVPDADPARLEQLLDQARGDTASGLAALDPADLERRAARLVALEAALDALAERVLRAEAVQRCLTAHRLDWLRIGGRQARFPREGAAREARLLVGEGAELDGVAALAGQPVTERSLYVEQAPQELAGALASAAAGELVGPWPEEGGWSVIVVDAKTAPAADDPEVLARVRGELLSETLDRLAAGRVRRHVDL